MNDDPLPDSSERLPFARSLLDIHIEGLRAVREQLDAEFSAAADAMILRLADGGKAVLTGLGKNLHIGNKLAATLNSTGTPAVMMHPSEAMHGDIGLLQPEDVLFVLSYSGESDELIKLLPVARRIGALVVVITGMTQSTAAQFADHVISVAVPREACPFNLAPTTSALATLAVGDALAMLLQQARGFSKEDYIRLHPGGAIGKALFKVRDIMRTGDRAPSASPEHSVQDAVLLMTQARSGSLAVVDSESRVLAIVTDGDLRRHISGGRNIADLSVADVMSEDPITIRADQLANEAFVVYEKHDIDDLIVVEDGGVLAGMIDIQDMPKLKLF